MVSIEEEQSQEDLQCLHQLPLLGFENVHEVDLAIFL